jgi:hypothetical protein
MNTQEARELGEILAVLVNSGQPEQASDLLFPVLAERTPFRLLDIIGLRLGTESLEPVNSFLDQVAKQRTMGGWIVIASALRSQLARDLPGAFERTRIYAIAADVWYAADSLGERVPGPAIVSFFEPARNRLASWREAANRWVRRMVGVSVHYWAKQAKGKPGLLPQAEGLLDLLSPLFSEVDLDAAKGVGWGLKTLGRYYPDLVADWLIQQSGSPYRSMVRPHRSLVRPQRALMLRKATLYMPAGLRKNVLEKFR